MSSRFICVRAWVRVSFLLKAEPYSIKCVYHIWFIQPTVWVASTFWLSWITLLSAWVYKHLLGSLLSVLWDKHLRMELLNHMANIMFNLWGTAKPFPTVIASFYVPISNVQRFQFLCILTNTCYFLLSEVKAILMSIKQYLIVIFICNSIMASEVQHPFTCFLDIWIYSLEDFQVLYHFSIGLFIDEF